MDDWGTSTSGGTRRISRRAWQYGLPSSGCNAAAAAGNDGGAPHDSAASLDLDGWGDERAFAREVESALLGILHSRRLSGGAAGGFASASGPPSIYARLRAACDTSLRTQLHFSAPVPFERQPPSLLPVKQQQQQQQQAVEPPSGDHATEDKHLDMPRATSQDLVLWRRRIVVEHCARHAGCKYFFP
jgi:hypothetical protein